MSSIDFEEFFSKFGDYQFVHHNGSFSVKELYEAFRDKSCHEEYVNDSGAPDGEVSKSYYQGEWW